MCQCAADKFELARVPGHDGGRHRMAETMTGDRVAEQVHANRIEEVRACAVPERSMLAIGPDKIGMTAVKQYWPMLPEIP